MDLISLSPRKQPGFTLIELMVAMAIITILTTAGIAAYTNYLKGARDSARATMAREIVTKVESYSGFSGAPSPGQVATLLTSEGITIEDPLGGRPVCVDHTGQARMVCKISYHQFTDGTYAVSYGVEKPTNLIHPHYSNKIGGALVADINEIYGSFVGNNKTLSITPSTPTVHLENKPDLGSIVVDAGTLSSSGGYTNGASEGGGCNTVVSFNEGETLNVSTYLIGACTGYHSGDPGAICNYGGNIITCFWGGTCNITFNNSGEITGNKMAGCP